MMKHRTTIICSLLVAGGAAAVCLCSRLLAMEREHPSCQELQMQQMQEQRSRYMNDPDYEEYRAYLKELKMMCSKTDSLMKD